MNLKTMNRICSNPKSVFFVRKQVPFNEFLFLTKSLTTINITILNFFCREMLMNY